ncbi:hypothetical protein INT46_002890 [Mucor plumbeus]|uniref:Uncharacterized protein n=1 Tax=Mucor plumbeus TaxID=97098 RepID=A0A8H7UZG8_9FUNG|nr:hypothetical protein INT46_002890 [Mucor plumbeus]
MFKKWKPSFSFSVAYSPVNETQHESLLEPEEQNDIDFRLNNQQQKQFPLLIYWIYFAYGIAMLLPWNVFITASGYFSTRFAGSIYQDNFQNYFSAYFNCSNLISLAVLLFIRQKKNNALKIDIVIPLSINLAIFSFFSVSSLATPNESTAVSIIQLTVLAETSQLLPKYMQAVMSGQGIAGVSVALFSLLTTLLFKNQQLDVIATFYYFISALLVTLIALIGRFALHRQPAYQLMVRHSTVDTSIPMTFTAGNAEEQSTTTLSRTSTSKNAMYDIITKKSSGYIFTIVYIYIITLALFPSLTVFVRSVNGINSATFISLHFLLFNIGDWIGRTLPIFTCCQVYSSKALIYISIARTLFVPLLFNCNLEQQQQQQQQPLLNSDMLYFIVILVFAISNGWLTSLVFIAAPSHVSHDEKPLVGSVISFFLVVGLALGGLSSFIFK